MKEKKKGKKKKEKENKKKKKEKEKERKYEKEELCPLFYYLLLPHACKSYFRREKKGKT